MANKIVTKTYGGPDKQILIAEDSYKVTLGAVIGNTGVSADSDGKKILKAGTPLAGDITKRNAEHAFVLATNASNAKAVLLHDVDVTAGDENGTIVLAGVVDLKKLDSATVNLLTAEMVAALPRIIFIES